MSNEQVRVLSQRQIEHYIETPKEITLNGATYILKEEPEHEWKFGDVAEYDGKRYLILKEYGVADNVSHVVTPRFLKVVDFETKNVKSIPKEHTKFLHSVDLSV